MSLSWKPDGAVIVGSPVWTKLDGALWRAPSSRRRSFFPLAAASPDSTIPNKSPSRNGRALRRDCSSGTWHRHRIGDRAGDRPPQYSRSDSPSHASCACIAAPPPDCLLIDAVTFRISPFPHAPSSRAMPCLSIAAASIMAKVTRDRLMAEYHRTYPEYNFLSHKGYGTAEHLQRLAEHGPCAIHRRTFAPVAQS